MAIFSAATFRTPGNGAASQNLFVIFNTGLNRVVNVRRVVLQVDATALLVTTMPLFKLSRISSYSGGQALSKERWEAGSSHADIEVRGRNTSDGGSQTNIVATPGDLIWQQYASRMATVVGQVIGDDNNIAPIIIESNPIVLRQNQGLLVHIEGPAGTSNPNTNHYFIQAVWEEVVP